MLLTHYYVLVALAAVLTGAWLFAPRKRTQITSLGAFIGWSVAALTGDSVEVFDGNVEEVVVNNSTNTALAVQQPGEFVAAPVSDELRLFFALWALLSALALILYIWGVYPPTDDDIQRQ